MRRVRSSTTIWFGQGHSERSGQDRCRFSQHCSRATSETSTALPGWQRQDAVRFAHMCRPHLALARSVGCERDSFGWATGSSTTIWFGHERCRSAQIGPNRIELTGTARGSLTGGGTSKPLGWAECAAGRADTHATIAPARELAPYCSWLRDGEAPTTPSVAGTPLRRGKYGEGLRRCVTLRRFARRCEAGADKAEQWGRSRAPISGRTTEGRSGRYARRA